MKKLPYIPDKKMYAAVMGACSWIRQSGYFNKATQYYADKYGVDVDELRKYVRTAQGNGQKQAAKREKRVYHWYVIVALRDYYLADDCGTYLSWGYSDEDFRNNTRIFVRRATSAKNARDAVSGTKGKDIVRLIADRHQEYIARHVEQYEKEEEANKRAGSLTWDDVKQWVVVR